MRQIIDGKRYDTETAEELCQLDSPPKSENTWHDTRLYRSPKGQFFLEGEGYAKSMWSQPIPSGGPNGRMPGSGLRLIAPDQARVILERQNEIAILEKLFPIEEG